MKYLIVLACLVTVLPGFSENALIVQWQGQASLTHASSFQGSFNKSPTTLRYLPQIRADYQMDAGRRLGFDLALDLYNHSLGDSLTDLAGEVYRLTFRYDTPNSQTRIGLQKINFGPARLLRVLQWFDQLDPRDPLALSPGVWAALGRHYFENGMNLRLWTMRNAPDPWRDAFSHTDERPWDIGGRLEYPLTAGTLGLTLHTLDFTGASGISENRAAMDLRLDALVGLWSEIMLSRRTFTGINTDELIAMAGVDYTFDIGNGLYLALEGLVAHRGEFKQELPWQMHSAALMANYTLGLEDALVVYIYRVKTPVDAVRWMPMLGWQHTQGNWLFYLALYNMPALSTGSNLGLPLGTGLQLNIALNH